MHRGTFRAIKHFRYKFQATIALEIAGELSSQVPREFHVSALTTLETLKKFHLACESARRYFLKIIPREPIPTSLSFHDPRSKDERVPKNEYFKRINGPICRYYLSVNASFDVGSMCVCGGNAHSQTERSEENFPLLGAALLGNYWRGVTKLTRNASKPEGNSYRRFTKMLMQKIGRPVFRWSAALSNHTIDMNVAS